MAPVVGTILVVAVLAVVGIAVARAVPDIARYRRLRRM